LYSVDDYRITFRTLRRITWFVVRRWRIFLFFHPVLPLASFRFWREKFRKMKMRHLNRQVDADQRDGSRPSFREFISTKGL